MQHPEEGTIHAWLDGALPADEAARIEEHIVTCATCAAAVAEARGLIAASSRIVSNLDVIPAGVVPGFAGNKRSRWMSTPVRSAIAATILVGIGLYSTGVIGRGAGPSETNTFAPAPIIPTISASQRPDSAVADATSRVERKVVAPRTIGPARETESRSLGVVVAAAPQANQAAEALKASTTGVADRAVLGASNADSIIRPQMSMAAAPPSIATAVDVVARPVPAMDSMRLVQMRTDQARAAGGGRGGRGRGGLAGISSSFAAAPSDELVASFAGCYELDQSTDVLPARFALLQDSASVRGEFPVRYVDSVGKPTARMFDAAWGVIDGRAVIRTTVRGVILSLVKVGVTVSGESVAGARTGRLTACR